MPVVGKDGTVFDVFCDEIDVTSMNRPDTNWRFVDAAGHEHRWHIKTHDGMPTPATVYRPLQFYAVPTVQKVIDSTGIDEDGYDYELSHLECIRCGEHIRPGSCADTNRVLIPGLRRYKVNGRSVTREVFSDQLYESTGIRLAEKD